MMKTALPVWADKTCEDCNFRVDNRCRRAITAYGYPQVVNHGKYQLACSYHPSGNTVNPQPQKRVKEKSCES